MSWVLIAAVSWLVLSLVLGLLIGGAVAMEERTEPGSEPAGGSALPGERALDGEGDPGALQVDEQGSLIS
jgi:hypothetical protein